MVGGKGKTMKDIGNVFWRNILDGWKVVDSGRYYKAVSPDGKSYMFVNWDGHEALAAQTYLRERARKDAAPPKKGKG